MNGWPLARPTAAAALGAALLVVAVPALSAPAEESCLICHSDRELTSAAGAPVFVDPEAFAGSVHGRAGIGCVGCHADLAGVEDFPHAPDLRPVGCARCHEPFGRTSLAGVHGLASPKLISRPVRCRDCHGYHDVLPSTDTRSAMSAALRPATCATCHPGAGANFTRGRVHEAAGPGGTTPAGVVRILYKALIGVLAVFFVAYISADLRGRKRAG